MELIYGVWWVGHCPPVLKQLNWEALGATEISATMVGNLHILSCCFFVVVGFYYHRCD